MKRIAAAFILLVLSTPVLMATESMWSGDDSWTPEHRATLLDMEIARTLMAAYGNPPTPPAGEWQTLERLISDWPAEIVERMPTRDAWGQPFRVAEGSEQWLLSSSGPDRHHDARDPDIDWSALQDKALTGAGPDDMVAGWTRWLLCPIPDSSAQKITMSQIRSIATAMESYAIDHDTYPTIDGFGTAEDIAEFLDEVYIRDTPGIDRWGNPIYVIATGDGYWLVSAGSDGVLDAPYGRMSREERDIWLEQSAGPSSSFESDIVFVDGQFHIWPEGQSQ